MEELGRRAGSSGSQVERLRSARIRSAALTKSPAVSCS